MIESKQVTIEQYYIENKEVLFDELHFTVILRNLISNSLKHINQGGTIRIRYSEDRHNHVVSVEDNGAGIDQNTLDQINASTFDEVLPKRLDGSGLGLEMIFGMVKLNGVSIVIESELGHGTKAIIAIPR